jgi:hypothetical protein
MTRGQLAAMDGASLARLCMNFFDNTNSVTPDKSKIAARAPVAVEYLRTDA